MDTLEFKTRTIVIPGGVDANPIIRIDLQYQLTRAKPYTQKHLDYLCDEFAVADYGSMLCQQLRRIEGVGSVEITYYGCRVEIGAYFNQDHMVETVHKTLHSTLTVSVPWTVHRDQDGSNWLYRFGVPLIRPGANVSRLDPATQEDDARFTNFGRKLAQGLTGEAGRPRGFEGNAALMKTPTTLDWPALDAGYDVCLARLIGTRKVDITWETGSLADLIV